MNNKTRDFISEEKLILSTTRKVEILSSVLTNDLFVKTDDKISTGIQ